MILATHDDPGRRDLARAIAIAEEALALAERSGQGRLAARLRRQLEQYRAAAGRN